MDLRQILKTNGLSHVEAAVMLECSTPTLNRYFHGEVPLEKLVAFRKAAVSSGKIALAVDIAQAIRERTLIHHGPPLKEREVRAMLLGEISWELKQMGKKPAEVRALLREVLG